MIVGKILKRKSNGEEVVVVKYTQESEMVGHVHYVITNPNLVHKIMKEESTSFYENYEELSLPFHIKKGSKAVVIRENDTHSYKIGTEITLVNIDFDDEEGWYEFKDSEELFQTLVEEDFQWL